MTGSWQTYRIRADTADRPEMSVHEFDSGLDGPTLLVLGGVHGNEVGGIVGAGSLTTAPLDLRRGRIRVVPVTHEAAYRAGTREGPDGVNLARVFPGDPAGSVTHQVAAMVAERLIRGSDALVDLHTSMPTHDMPLFAGGLDDGTEVATRGVELAVAFGAGIVWTHPATGPGRTLSVAAELGVPAIYAESPTGGVLDRGYLLAYADGVRRVLVTLGMLHPGEVAAANAPRLWLHGNGDTDTFTLAPCAGLYLGEVGLLDRVAAGQRVGSIVDERGRVRAEVAAADSGIVVSVQRGAVVEAGTTVLGVARARPAQLGFPSDLIARQCRRGPT